MIQHFMACLALFLCTNAMAQKQTPYIHLVEPNSSTIQVDVKRQFLIGKVCQNCELTINGDKQFVYSTGAFVYEVNLKQEETSFVLTATLGKQKKEKTITYRYVPPQPKKPVSTFSIEQIRIMPEGDLRLMPGDEISLRVKAFPQCRLMVENRVQLSELTLSQTGGMPGIYQGKFRLRETDTFNNSFLKLMLISEKGDTLIQESKTQITMLNPEMPEVVVTKGRLAHLLYGLGEDRLGGAKMSYIDSMIPLRVIGKVGSNYKVRLTPERTAYIPDDRVAALPKGALADGSLTGKIKVYGDSVYDFACLQLFSKLPYQSNLLTDPSRIVVDVFGATANTNWIDQLNSAKEITKVEYEQIADEVFRITISLKHAQHWGHKIFYKDNNLIIRIKRQPVDLSWNRLTIAVDAGHGGNNTGAVGATGALEKDITLQLSLKLKALLEQKGVRVLMTREKEQFVDNKERILIYRDQEPDMLVSIHLNSSSNPFEGKGTSTFYRYEGFRNLSKQIYESMLELGLKEYGNNGSFNFMLNSPTEYPNALVECLFLSNPEEEALVLDPAFQDRIAEKILLGIGHFLESCL